MISRWMVIWLAMLLVFSGVIGGAMYQESRTQSNFESPQTAARLPPETSKESDTPASAGFTPFTQCGGPPLWEELAGWGCGVSLLVFVGSLCKDVYRWTKARKRSPAMA